MNSFILKRRVVLDSECDSLTPTIIHCIVCKDLDSGEIFKFRPNSPLGGHEDFKEEFLTFAKDVELWVGHNIIGFDMPVINRLLDLDVIKLKDCRDTLVLSRLFRPTPPKKPVKTYNRGYGHSLEAWGNYLNFPKIHFNEFEKFTEEMLEYCVQDVLLGEKVYIELWYNERTSFSQECIDLEHSVAFMVWEQEQNGFYLDKDKALKLEKETSDLLEEMNVRLQELFPPEFKFIRNLPKKIKKDGTLGTVFVRILDAYMSNTDCKVEKKEDDSYDLYIRETFNPKSGQHKAKRLLALGWNPKHYTDKGNIKTDKDTLEEAITELLEDNTDLESLRCLSDYSIVSDRHQKAVKWLELGAKDGRVHGRVNPIGAATHRCSHYDDNMANIARVVTKKLVSTSSSINMYSKFDKFTNSSIWLNDQNGETNVALTGLEGGYGWDSRDCWSVPTSEHCLVGADASGIQLRALAHYMHDKDYIQKLLESDIHVVHQQAAGISSRARAKTFIYAWLLGGGDEKIGSIVGIKEEEYEELFDFARNRRRWNQTLLESFMYNLRNKGRKADKKTVATIIKGFKTKEQFLDRTPALKRLRKEDVPRAAKQGYLIGLDGRKLWIPSDHLAMSLYLQGFEVVIMKKAMHLYQEELHSKNVPFKQVAFVHDEFQIETYNEYGDVVGQAVVDAIKKAGEIYNSNCPLDGEYKVGRSWAQTH